MRNGVPKYICQVCCYKKKPEMWKPGSLKIEIVLWLLGGVPGLMYSLWRRVFRTVRICPECRTATMISTATPHGQKMIGA